MAEDDRAATPIPPPSGQKAARPWKPGEPPPSNTDPDVFAKLPIKEKIEVMSGMIAVVKQFGGNPKEMLREVIRTLSPEQKAQIAADPALKAQLQRLLDIL